MKGETVKLILQTISENPVNIYDALEERGYSKDSAWSYIPRLKLWGYIEKVGRSKYTLTEKGKKRLNRLLYGLSNCPFCGSNRIKLNGKRDGTGKQRYLCNSCGFTWSEGKKEEAIMRALKKRRKTIFIMACEQRYAYGVLNYLKEFLREVNAGKVVEIIIP